MTYIVSVMRCVDHGCTSEAGQHGGPICKHWAAFYLLSGMLDPEPPATLDAAA